MVYVDFYNPTYPRVLSAIAELSASIPQKPPIVLQYFIGGHVASDVSFQTHPRMLRYDK